MTCGAMTGRGYARAHTNIALSKYWGKRDAARNVPAMPSLSAGLADFWVEAEVAFGVEGIGEDVLLIDGLLASVDERERVSRFLDVVRERAGGDCGPARVETRSNFPRAAGLASSAAAFAALTLAVAEALGLTCSDAELSALARRGSGSAARSLFEGYVEFPVSGPDPHAVPLAAASHFPLEVAVVISGAGEKAVPSRAAMEIASETSPFYSAWIASAERDFAAIREAVLARHFEELAERVEHNCLAMHATSMTSTPPVLYWSPTTLEVIRLVRRLRADGVGAFFTIDAGPNAVVFCRPSDREPLWSALESLGVEVRSTAVGGAIRRGRVEP